MAKRKSRPARSDLAAKRRSGPAVRIETSPPELPPLPTPIIVVHGNPASNLLDLYLTTPDPAYALSKGWFLRAPSFEKEYDRLPFHPDDPKTTLNTTGKTVTPARLAAINAFYLPYEDLVERLKRDVGTREQPAPVFPLAYDWRFDSSVGAQVLDRFITEVLRITSRLPMYKGAPPKEVDIVAHSFGGLVTARYLRSRQRRPVRSSRVRKVVTIATPFRGAVDAMFRMIKDLDQRETARTLPSVYGLLPTFDGATLDPEGRPIDLLRDSTLWAASSVERSLDEYCKRMGSRKDGRQRLRELRDTAIEQQEDLARLDVATALGTGDSWLPIVGVGSKTRIETRVVRRRDGVSPGAEFDFRENNEGPRTGDNTVPFLGAVPPFNLATGARRTETPRQRLVCFKEDDIGLHERGEWMGLGNLLGLVTLHAFLPSMDAVQQAIIGFLRPTPPHFRAKARPAPEVEVGEVDWPASWYLDAR